MIVDGRMQYLFDEKGRRYLDVSPLYCTYMYKCVYVHEVGPPRRFPLDLSAPAAATSARAVLLCTQHAPGACPLCILPAHAPAQPLPLYGSPWRPSLPVGRTASASMPVLPASRPGLQGFAGIVTVSVGHCHPKVTQAVIEQTQRLQHTTTIYLNDQVGRRAR